jgi:hypothetical protein
MECSSVAIAAGLDESTEWVEERCEALVRRYQFLTPARLVELPDGTMTARYKFSHVLYLEVPYRLLPPMRRSQIHRRVGQRGEAIARTASAELPRNSRCTSRGRQSRAVKYLLHAATSQVVRTSPNRALAAWRDAPAAPATAERDQHELRLMMILGVAVMASASRQTKQVICSALLERVRHHPSQTFRPWLLTLFYYFRAELEPAEKIGRQLLMLADTSGNRSSSSRPTAESARSCSSSENSTKRSSTLRMPTAPATTNVANQRSRYARRPPKWSMPAMQRAQCGHLATRIRPSIGPSARCRPLRTSGTRNACFATHFAAQLNQLRGERAATRNELKR